MIDIRNLSFGYGPKTVFENINVHIRKGGFYALMGANGSGKTTLLRCMGNLLRPTHGSVEVDGVPVQQFTARELACKMAYVRQQMHTDFEFSGFEMVLMGRNPYQRRLQNESQQDWDIVEQCMRLTNTWHLRFSRPGEMSGGELQRVMIARALAQQTDILLLDEPVSNLDIAHQFEILDLMKKITVEQHKTVVLVIHDLNAALRYCSDLMLLHKSTLFYHGAIRQGLTPLNIKTVFGIDASLVDIDEIPTVVYSR